MFKTKELQFRGAIYKIAYMEPSPCHASWFSFDDESSVRDSKWLVGPGDVVLDVGAAYGSYTMTALSQGASKAYAWSPQGEPDLPSERDFFVESLRLNGWEDRCTIYASGVFDKTGWLDAMTQKFSTDPLPPSVDVIQVSKLDDWYEAVFKPENPTHGKVWMKLDVEGAEV